MRGILLLVLALASCGEPVADDHFANNFAADEPPAAAVTIDATPVRIGEYGLNFDACPWVGTTRHVEPRATLAIRAAPFEAAAETGSLPAGARFFVCARSLDQKWFGIVHDEAGDLAPLCGVSDPVAAKRAYQGPCKSGWVSSAFVKLIAGNDVPLPPNQGPPEAPAAPPAPAEGR